MNEQETLMLCRLAKAMCPQQAVDEYTPDAWHLLLSDLRFVDAKDALVNLGRRQPFVAPSEIYKEVKRIRTARCMEFGPISPPPEMGERGAKAYNDWLRESYRRIGDGMTREEYEREFPTPQVDPAGQERVKELLSGAFKRIPDDTDPEDEA